MAASSTGTARRSARLRLGSKRVLEGGRGVRTRASSLLGRRSAVPIPGALPRNIKGFIVQTGDPTNTGKGGESIWGRKFADEFRPTLKHNARGIVSMANSGPDTNGSQFFITYAKHTHLDHVYTIFGK